MQQSRQKTLALGALLVLGITSTAQAALIDRGDGLIYDDVLDVTWLQDANYAFTSGYAGANAVDSGSGATDNIFANGRMGWDAANTWAANLSFGGYDDWRLTTMTDTGTLGCNSANSGTDCGYNIDTDFSEMAYMYHNNLGLKSRLDASGVIQSDYGVFGNGAYNGVDKSSLGEKDFTVMQNVQAFVYWSGVEFALAPAVGAWSFVPGDGHQRGDNKNEEFYAWAVRDGDVTAVPPPVPFWLIGSRLIGLLGWKRKR
ncbi:MAG: DUF1566 domain-containing protein [Methyloprofundus sp.]|nr:DUF1566 domain-containing protein [Methyloprofundus sp.]